MFLYQKHALHAPTSFPRRVASLELHICTQTETDWMSREVGAQVLRSTADFLESHRNLAVIRGTHGGTYSGREGRSVTCSLTRGDDERGPGEGIASRPPRR